MIRINNRDELEWEEGMTVSSLLERLKYTFAHIIVRVNGEIVPPEKYATYLIPDGAQVLVIHLIAGG
ncbi:MAG: sulfur carrier protein ThiS [Anaerolineae bacterium]|nr:sulfur carrier protein ThiS [Anaerolineae bacterium]